jgi:hypothetical protein
MLRGQAQAEHVPEALQQLVAPHVDSFNYFVGEGLAQVVQHLPAAEVQGLKVDVDSSVHDASMLAGRSQLDCKKAGYLRVAICPCRLSIL